MFGDEPGPVGTRRRRSPCTGLPDLQQFESRMRRLVPRTPIGVLNAYSWPVDSAARSALEGREDLAAYGGNALGLFALELRFELDDITTVADSALTDGEGDRRCDLLYVDREQRTAVIGQIYEAEDPTKAATKVTKASDLATAVTWVLGAEDLSPLPVGLRSAIEELRTALQSGEIDVVELWYVHNLARSTDADTELREVQATAVSILEYRFPDLSVDVRAVQVDADRLEGWYRSSISAIYVGDSIDVPTTSDAFEETGDGWSAVCTSVRADWVHDLYAQYGDDLFSANVRSPMPSRRSEENINFQIERTAREDPARFFAYNNGITAIVNEYSLSEDGRRLIAVRGIAVVNGAQTTGAVSRVERDALAEGSVLARFVQSPNNEVVRGIITNNNRQNPIKPSDYRSMDEHQRRLRDEFETIPDALYLGARRGGESDFPKKPSNFVSSDTAAQALAAFHGEPATAYNDLRLIWDRNDLYARFFNEATTAAHIVFVFSLLRAVQEWKAGLIDRGEELDEVQRDALSFLRKRGSTFLFVSAVAASMESVMQKKLPDLSSLSFGPTVSPGVALEYWQPLVDALGSFTPQLDRAESSAALQRGERADDRISAFQQIVRASSRGLEPVFADFRIHVVDQAP